VRLGPRYWLRFRRRQWPRLRPGFRRRGWRLWLWFGRRPRRRHWVRRRHWRRDRCRLQVFRPRRFRRCGFARYFAAGRRGFMGQICKHPEMIPSRALCPPRGSHSVGQDRTEHPGGSHPCLGGRLTRAVASKSSYTGARADRAERVAGRRACATDRPNLIG